MTVWLNLGQTCDGIAEFGETYESMAKFGQAFGGMTEFRDTLFQKGEW